MTIEEYNNELHRQIESRQDALGFRKCILCGKLLSTISSDMCPECVEMECDINAGAV